MPAYREALHKGIPVTPLDVSVDIPVGNQVVEGQLLRTQLPGSDVPVYLVAQDYYFNRPSLYGEDGLDYRDNCERFVFFSVEPCWKPSACWTSMSIFSTAMTGKRLIPVFLKTEYRAVRAMRTLPRC